MAKANKFKELSDKVLKYLKDKGEKIALGVCLAIMVLFGAIGLWGSITAPSPKANADEMKKQADSKKSAFANAEPGDSDKPGPESTGTKLALIDKVDPSAYRGRQMFSESEFIDTKRRPPNILTIDDAKASVARVAVRSYMFSKDLKSITVLKGGGAPGGAMAGPGGAQPGGNNPNTAANAGNKSKNITLFLNKKAAASKTGNPYAGISDKWVAYLKNIEYAGRKPLEFLTVSADEYEKMKGSGRPAEQSMPVRMVIVNATFPYRAQLEEFRNKLKLNSFNEVLSDSTANPDDPNQSAYAFRFLGMNVERRKKKPDGSWDAWKALDLKGKYLPIAQLADFRFEPEDPNLGFYSIPGLIMPKLAAFDPTQYPKLEDAELALPKIKAQVDELERKNKELLALSKPKSKAETFDVFSVPAGGSTGPGMGGPGEGGPGIRPPGPAGPGGPGAPGSMAVPQGPDSEPPIHNLVRFIDVDVEPGDTYEYRVQVRMGNPNFKRNKEVASPSYADGADLTSDWSKIPIQVKVPEEQNCYVVDQYKADNPNARPIASEDRTRMIPIQIHKWLQTSGLATQNMPVGDWGIAERVPVYRGEFIGRDVVAKVPMWIFYFEGFGLVPPKVKATPGTKVGDGNLVDFRPDRKDRPDFILVDFDGSDYTHERVKYNADGKPTVTRVEEKDKLVEAYILAPDGSLQVRTMIGDRDLKERKDRLDNFRDRVKRAEDFMRGGTGAAGGSPFGS